MIARSPSSMKPRLSDEDLHRLYIVQRLSANAIATIADRDSKTVWTWLREAGIPTRPRGMNLRESFNKHGRKPSFTGKRHSVEARRKIGLASLAQGRVPYLRYGKHWLKDAPPEANPRWKGGATPERQEFYRSKEWKQVCRAVWKRAGAKCERCRSDYSEADRQKERFHIHHIEPFANRALRAELSNLALLCPACHRFVHSAANIIRQFLPPATAAE